MARRASNYTSEEKDFMIELVTRENTWKVIECKEIDKVSLKKKNDEWRNIALEFNCGFSSVAPRTVEQLKLLYKNLKTRTRKKIADLKVERKITDGGPCPVQIAESEHKLISVLSENFNPLPSNYDDDDVGYHYLNDRNREVGNETDEEESAEETEQIPNEAREPMRERCIKDLEIDHTVGNHLGENNPPFTPVVVLSNNDAQTPAPHSSTTPVVSDSRKRKRQMGSEDLLRLRQLHMQEEHNYKMILLQKEMRIKDATLKKIEDETHMAAMKHKIEMELLEKRYSC